MQVSHLKGASWPVRQRHDPSGKNRPGPVVSIGGHNGPDRCGAGEKTTFVRELDGAEMESGKPSPVIIAGHCHNTNKI